MAQLRWQPVEAPQGSIRDIALASANISGSFDKLGLMLAQREATLRKEATDAQATQVLLAKDDQGLDAAQQAALSTGNRRVDGRAIAELVNSQRGLLQDRWIKGDQIKDKEALNAFGEMVPQFTELYYNNKDEQLKALQDGLSGEEGFNRFMAQKFDTFQKAFETGVGHRQTALRDDRADRRDGQRIAASNAANALARERWELEKGELLEKRAGFADAQEYIRTLPAGASTKDVVTTLINSGALKGKSQTYISALTGTLEDPNFGRDRALTPTEQQSLLVSGDIGKLGEIATQAGVVGARNLNRVAAKNVPMQMIDQIEKHKDVTAEQVWAAFESRGIDRDSVEAYRAQNQLGYPEMMAVASNGRVGDPSLISLRTGRGLARGGLLGAAAEYFLGGEREAAKATAQVRTGLQDEGQRAKFEADKAKATQAPAALQAEAAAVAQRILRKQARGEDIAVERALLQQLEKRLETARSGQ